MSHSYVALDLETTGLDPERDEITEVGAVRFDAEGRELETFSQLVNPGRPIPRFVQELTGVTDEAVAGAPAVKAIADDLRRFIGDGPIVGQNIRFDLDHLRHAGIPIAVPWIDTAELARMLLPLANGRGLMEIAGALGVEAGVHHRALPDARTAAAIFVGLRRRAALLPEAQRLQLTRLVALHNPLLAETIGGERWEEMPAGEKLIPAVRPAPAVVPLTRREPREPVPFGELAAVFDAGRGTFRGFEERGEQRAMADAVLGSLNDGGHWLVEAGTGVGKSLAYLAPAALHALRNGERVVISTNTHALQEQLLTKDVPALRKMLVAANVIPTGDDLRVALLKGRGNYLCLRRWTASYGANMADPDFASLASRMLLWLQATETGDRAEVGLADTDWQTWQRFSAQDTDCLVRQNAWVRDGSCFLLRARKAAESAHLVIVNHALLLADLASGGSAVPPYDHLVIDEAHNLEDVATKQFGGTVSRRLLAEALDGLHRPPGRNQREGGVVTLLKAFPEGAARNAGIDLEAAVAKAVPLLLPCFASFATHVPAKGDEDKVLLDRSLRAQPAWTDTELAWQALDRALVDVTAKAGAAAKLIADTALVEEPDAIAGEIDSAARKVEELRSLLAQLMAANDDGTIVWIGRDGRDTASVSSAPLDVGPTLWDELFAKKRTVVATSATLAAAGSMEFAARRMGFEKPETLQLGSPYDYEASTLLAALTDIPEPNDRAYHPAVAEAVIRLVRASEGRALALFTSHEALRRVAEIVRPVLEEEGIAVLAQGVDGSPKRLQENLIASPRSVILGTQSFWEGVDIRGDALSLLIIARLPFTPPTDPVHRARGEQYDNPFGQYALPAAILKFRQGFGRLIRDRNDRGVVAVLDRRIFSSRYGEDFVRALPRCTRIKTTTDVIALRTREWLS
ncbi:MAG: 3'-5' exoribonuclease [Dehalococcoidia bacterium]|nr:3'-5' exoribonuclease [Dehalococcoidia bacterium]